MMTLLRVLEHPVIESVGWALLHFVWQGLLLAGLLSLLLVPLRRVSSHARYLMLCTTFSIMAICPVVTWCWLFSSIPPVREAVTAFPTSLPEPAPVAAESPKPSSIIGPQMSTATVPAVPALEGHAVAEFEVGTRPMMTVGAPDAFTETPVEASSWTTQLHQSTAHILPWLVSGWLFGVLVLSTRLLAGWRAVLRIKRLATKPASHAWHERLQRLALRLRVTRPVQLIESTLVSVPTVIGWLRPMILLPTSVLTGLDPSQLEALLAHELAHIRRHDFLINLIQTAVETLLFYHPAIWWLSQRIRNEREHCCDDLAVEVCGNNVTYARALATMEELRSRPTLTMAADGGSLLGRIRRLICSPSDTRRSTWGASLIAMTAIAALGLGAYLNSRANADPQAKSERVFAELPGQIEVELIGVGYHQWNRGDWWHPDGTPLANPSEDAKFPRRQFQSVKAEGKQGECRQFLIRMKGFPEHQEYLATQFVYEEYDDSTSRGILYGPMEIVLAQGPPFFKSDKTPKTTNLCIGVGELPERDFVRSIDVQGKKLGDAPTSDAMQLADGLIQPVGITEANNQTELIFNFTRRLDAPVVNYLRPVAIDKKGGRHELIRDVGQQVTHALVYDLPLKDIARFEYRLRPYRHWLTFENVSLVPGSKTEVKVKVESLPEEKADDTQQKETSEKAQGPNGEEAIEAPGDRTVIRNAIRGKMAILESDLAASRMIVQFKKLTDQSWISGKTDQPLVKTAGKLNWIGDGKRWRIDYDGQLPQSGSPYPSPDLWSTGFDGEQTFLWDRVRNSLTYGTLKSHAEQFTPANLFFNPTHGGVAGLDKALTQPDLKLFKSTDRGLEGIRAEYTVVNNGTWRWTAFFATSRSCLATNIQQYHDDRLAWECQLSDLVELQPGLWYPRQIHRSIYTWTKAGERQIAWQDDFKITKFEIAAKNPIAAQEFQVSPLFGSDIKQLAQGWTFHNDPWWNDLVPQLREKYGWPKRSLARLELLRSNLKEPPGDRAVPALSIGQPFAVSDDPNDLSQERIAAQSDAIAWFNSQPLDWKQLDGKVTLLVFWARWDERGPEVLCALKQIHEAHASHGLQVIAVSSPEKISRIRSIVDELKLPYPVVVDGNKDAVNGMLYDAFGVRGMPCAVLVDHQRKIHPIVDGRDIPQQLVTLLTAAGAVNPPLLSFQQELSDAQVKEIQSAWLELVGKSPKTSWIQGKIVDGQNRPVANARVEALLSLHLLGSVDGSHLILPDYQGKHLVQTDDNGEYKIPNLVKGQYELTVTADVKAVLKQMVILNQGEPRQVDLSLADSGAISGKVLANGKPVANAKVEAEYRHFDPENPDRTIRSPGAMPTTTTDAEGRFHFKQLETGLYTFVITADGFQPVGAPKVPVGQTDLTVNLSEIATNQVDPDNAAKPNAKNAVKKQVPLLDRRVEIQSDSAPLQEVLASLCESVGANLELDGDGLKRMGYTKNMPVTIKVEDIKLSSALKLVLTPYQLAYAIDGETIFVSNLERVAIRNDQIWTKVGYGPNSNGLRCRLVPVSPSSDPEHPDPAKVNEQFAVGEDITFVVELLNASDKPLTLLGVRYGDTYRAVAGALATGFFAPLFFEFEFMDEAGRPMPRTSRVFIDRGSLLQGASGHEIAPGRTLTVLLRPAQFQPPMNFQLPQGNFQAKVHYRGPDVKALADIRKHWPESIQARAWSHRVTSGTIAFTVAGDPSQQKPAELIWGKATNGLQAALEFRRPAGGPQSFDPTGPVPLKTNLLEVLHVKNVSDQIITFGSESGRQGDELISTNEAGEEQKLQTTFFTGEPILVRWTLQPGQVAELQTLSSGASQVTESGKYTFRYRVNMNSLQMKDDAGNVTFPTKDDWKGVIETGETPLNLRVRTAADDVKPEENASTQTQTPNSIQLVSNAPAEADSGSTPKTNRREAIAPSIARGIEFLKSKQQDDGSWPESSGNPNGVTALATVALLQAGVKATDPAIQKALVYLRKNSPNLIYHVALQVIVFSLASAKEDAELIRSHVAWIEKAQNTQGQDVGGWSYQENPMGRADGSCTRFAILGLHAAQQAGFEVKAETWQRVAQYWLSTQQQNGNWGYTSHSNPTSSMTLAGIACLATAHRFLPDGDQVKVRQAAILKAANAVAPNLRDLGRSGFPFYTFHCLERAGNLTETRKFGDVDWRAEVVLRFLSSQHPNGKWTSNSGAFGNSPAENEFVATSFAIMTLSGVIEEDAKDSGNSKN